MLLRGEKKEKSSDFLMTILVKKYDKQLLKSIEAKLRKIFRENFEGKVKTNLYFEDVNRYVFDEISARIYIKKGYRIYSKTLTDVLGGIWAYDHHDIIGESPHLECYEHACWDTSWNKAILLHPELVRAFFFDITKLDLSKKEILPISWIKAGRTEPTLPTHTITFSAPEMPMK